MLKYPNNRLRRLRQNQTIRNLIQENTLTPSDLIYPMFIVDGKKKREPITSLPNIERVSIDECLKDLEIISKLNISGIALFPVVPADKKSRGADEAFNSDNLINSAIRAIKKHFPKLLIISDVALDPYTIHGQDGLLASDLDLDLDPTQSPDILNDQTCEILVKQALSQAEAGVDIIAPSDMMDGRIGLIRTALEQNGFYNTLILSYAAKYASSFYGPFREAVGSKSQLGKADKKTYQMDPANSDEALREVEMDISEGADMVMIKPGLPYLDIVSKIKNTFNIPTFAYHVSGEYAMLKAAAQKGWIDERSTVLESIMAFKRAGCDGIFTYYAKDIAQWLS